MNRLEEIILNKKKEVNLLKDRVNRDRNHSISKILREEYDLSTKDFSFKKSLHHPSLLAIIAEIKRRSPSKGAIAPIQDPISLAHEYIQGGANAISILTDAHYFGGSLDDLIQVKDRFPMIPILRKDFIIDTIQIAEAVAANASAILCIAAVLGKQLKSFLEYARLLRLDVLVEVHDSDEIQLAIDSGAEIIGINNRDLKTFHVDTNLSMALVEMIPEHIIRVAESGILEPSLARQYHQHGFNAVLIGEALVRASDPAQFIQACNHA